MDFRQLEAFVRVAELGSFTRAATVMHTSQPALSRQVRLLEVQLRQNLLTRNGRGAVPTEAGKVLLAHGRGILHQVERAIEEIGRVRGSLAGHVTVGLPSSLARVLTVPLTRTFKQELPLATIAVMEGLSTALRESLIAGRLDLAVLYNAQAADDVEIAHLMDEELVLVQRRPAGLAEDPPPGPIELRALAEFPLVIPSRPNAIRMQLESELVKLGLPMNISLEIDGVSAILDLVADGAGSAVLSRQAVRSSVRPAAYTMRAIVSPPLRTHIGLATSALRPTTLTQQATLQLLRRTIHQCLQPA